MSFGTKILNLNYKACEVRLWSSTDSIDSSQTGAVAHYTCKQGPCFQQIGKAHFWLLI